MRHELRWALLVLCYFGVMALNYVVEHPSACVYFDNQNSAGQGCISEEQNRMGMFGVISVFFLCVIIYEMAQELPLLPYYEGGRK